VKNIESDVRNIIRDRNYSH